MLIEDFTVRAMTPADLERAGSLLYESFADAHRERGLLEPIADATHGSAIARAYHAIDPDGCLVVERQGQVVGIGFVHVRGQVAAVGPLAVAPRAQSQGFGKRLLRHLEQRTEGCTSVRALVDAFSQRALGMAATHGFAARDAVLHLAALGGLRGPGRLLGLRSDPTRPMTAEDLGAVADYDSVTFGGSRLADFQAALATGAGLCLEEGGEIRGFLFGRVEDNLGILGPGAAGTVEELATLTARLGEQLGERANILQTALAASQPELVRQALSMGFRATSTSIYMTRGEHTPFTIPRVIGVPGHVC